MNTIAPTISPPPVVAVTAPELRPRVLVADDSRVIRSAIKKILDSEFDVVLAESGDVAWSLLSRENNFHMLVTDIEMPGMDGYELICHVRGSDQASLKKLPVLTITGADDEQTKERAFACGATDFIIKPIDGIQLKARVQSYVRMESSARDMAEKATQLEDQAINDPVTSLRSRRYFLQRGEQDVALCTRNQQDLTVIRFDIDRFKDIYRKHGDDVSDSILTWLAGILANSARVEDTVARVGGAKFAILATNTEMRSAKRLCQRIREAMQAKPFLHNGKIIDLTLSFGLSSLLQDNVQQIEPLLELAEQRVTHAEADGGDRVCISILGDSAPNIEEVVLDVPPPSRKRAASPPVVEPLPVSTLSDVDELEMPSVEIAAASSRAPTPTSTDIPMELISVDKALQLIASGQEQLLEPYLKSLMKQLKPLLELAIRKR